MTQKTRKSNLGKDTKQSTTLTSPKARDITEMDQLEEATPSTLEAPRDGEMNCVGSLEY